MPSADAIMVQHCESQASEGGRRGPLARSLDWRPEVFQDLRYDRRMLEMIAEIEALRSGVTGEDAKGVAVSRCDGAHVSLVEGDEEIRAQPFRSRDD